MRGRIEIDQELCKGCGLCTAFCPKGRIEISGKLNTKGYYPATVRDLPTEESEKERCTGCALCAITCPDVAIEVYREEKKKSKE